MPRTIIYMYIIQHGEIADATYSYYFEAFRLLEKRIDLPARRERETAGNLPDGRRAGN